MEDKEKLEAELIAALLADSQDKEYLEEIALWDCLIGDGISDSDPYPIPFTSS